MTLPREVGVMTLPNATLFPQALLPLYIFEPRYRRMLADALEEHRVFCVAMQRPGCTREAPAAVAGVGLIRVSVEHRDGTSHLILQGLARAQLLETLRYKPYRVHRIQVLAPPPCNERAVGLLVASVRELMAERVALGLPFPCPVVPGSGGGVADKPVAPPSVAKEILRYMDDLKNPEHLVDLVSCAVLQGAEERQTILATVDVEARLRCLARFLSADIRRQRQEAKR